jgi:hypothetical protein
VRAAFLSGLVAVAALASPASAEDAWTRAGLPSGLASVETPCAEGRAQTSSTSGGEAVRCMEGTVEIGVGLTNATAYGIEAKDLPVFDGFIATAREKAKSQEALPLSTFRGRRSLMMVQEARAMALVEMSHDTMLLFMVRPLPGKTPDEPLANLLDRMMNSLEIHDESAKS